MNIPAINNLKILRAYIACVLLDNSRTYLAIHYRNCQSNDSPPSAIFLPNKELLALLGIMVAILERHQG